MQVYLCTALLREFKRAEVKRRIFVEPRLSSLKSGEHHYPDIVICNTRRIIGVVELKYLPRAIPAFRKDIATLEFAAANANRLVITNDRYRGITADNRHYPLAPDAVLCWGAVYTGKAMNLQSKVHATLQQRFLQLSAITATGEAPKVRIDEW
ncbi:MAG: hypothetical protein GXY83_34390 [Rhodopirellula sp.]|nr:hypothetical protein [Rhodopirellula sp.]